jgi:NADH-quinone oxidoreductase subunit I
MYGSGILKTLAMTFYHFLMTYVEDVRAWGRRHKRNKDQAAPQRRPTHGVFTQRYPEERPVLPERYRSLPLFVIDGQTEQLRCTACGICAQICPVQCIWIERAKDPDTGRPRRYPLTYNLDPTLCMSCGYCAEFCPFDAIKMDQEFELATYRRPGFVSARDLAKPESYHARIHPTDYAQETQPKPPVDDPDV